MRDLTVSPGLVLDASVWINLLATDAIDAILAALAVPCHAPQQVLMEVNRHPVTGAAFTTDRHPLASLNGVSIVALAGAELDLFVDIVGAPMGEGLGDGEAAAIAVAVSRNLDLVIDDRKARRIVRERFGQVQTHWTIDILRAQSVVSAVGASLAEEYFARAKRFGRMHVPRSSE
jgi:predicted nucleic acid-binding protein